MSIVLKSVDFEWPNGHVVFRDLNLAFESGQKYGLIGPNGSGKSTLAKLVQGELAPNRGKIQTKSRVSYFPQFEHPPDTPVAEYLSELWYNVTPADTDILEALQARLEFESSCRTLSGGEWTRVRLLKQLSAGADFIILDEPTNNLDMMNLEFLENALFKFKGAIIVISHDITFLDKIGITDEIQLT